MSGASLIEPDFAVKKTRVWLALVLRGQGKKYKEIGGQMGVTESRAHQMVKEAIDSISTEIRESAFDVLTLELTALNELAARAWKKLGPDGFEPEVVNTLLRIMERRAKYLGLDAPVDVRVDLYARGGAARAAAGEIDLKLLSVEDLEALEHAKVNELRILERARRPVMALMAGPGIEVPEAAT